MHQVDVLDEGSTQRLGNRLPSPVGHQTAPDLFLDLVPQLLDQCLDLFPQQPLLELGQLLVTGEGRHELGLQLVEVDATQGPIQVVGAANRATRLHPGETVYRLAHAATKGFMVHPRQRLEEGIEEPLLIELPSPAGRGPGLPLRRGGTRKFLSFGQVDRKRHGREVDVECGVEGALVTKVLHQGRPQGLTERHSTPDVDGLHSRASRRSPRPSRPGHRPPAARR